MKKYTVYAITKNDNKMEWTRVTDEVFNCKATCARHIANDTIEYNVNIPFWNPTPQEI